MSSRLVVRLTHAVLSGVLAFLLVVPRSAAQETPSGASSAPPEPGAVVFEDSLTAPGALQLVDCATGRASARFTPEGYLLSIAGKCGESATSAALSSRVWGLVLPDGEVRLDWKVVAGEERTHLELWYRDYGFGRDGYLLHIEPARGVARIDRWESAGNQYISLAERTDLGALISHDGWNALVIRLEGPSMWMWLNDELVLTAQDSVLPTGEVGLGLTRLGDPEDDQQTRLVLRNLRVLSLAAGDPARAPTRDPDGVLLADDFDNPDRGLFSRSGSSGGYSDSEYVLRTLQPGMMASRTVPRMLVDSVVTVHARLVGNVLDRIVVIGCRRQPAGADATGEYYLGLEPLAGRFAIMRRDQGRSVALVGPRHSSAIRLLNASNNLALRCSGTTIAASINGTEVAAVEDGTYQQGYVFIGAGTFSDSQVTVEARFDNFLVTEPGSQVPLGGTPARPRPTTAG